VLEAEEAGVELGEEDVVRTNSTEEVEGESVGEDERGNEVWEGEVVRSMLLDRFDRCCGKGGDALD